MRSLDMLVTVALLSVMSDSVQEVPAHLRLAAAEIAEAERTAVVFRIESDGAPTCGTSYAFLIDTDKSQKTGAVTRALPELGIDLQVEMHCDAARGTFVSQAGDVTVRRAATAGEPHVIEVAVAREALPSLDFYWIAVARDGKQLARLPAPGRYEAWRPLEQWLH